MVRRAFLCLMVLLAPVTRGAEEQELRVLMIGNSYTAMTVAEVRAFLDADPAFRAEVVAHAPGGRTLRQHAADPKVATLLKDSGRWDVIVLQDQSQVPALAMIGKDEATRDLDGGAPVLIRRIREEQPGARILLFETWARHREPDKQGTLRAFGGDPGRMQRELSKGYRHLLRNPGEWDFSAHATIVPVGQAFAAWYAEHGYGEDAVGLHRSDRSHPSKAGAYLTGAMFYRALTSKDPAKTGYRGGQGVPADAILAVVRAASR